MNSLMTNNSVRMTSREIAELTGKLHKNVIRDIREMLKAIGEDGLKFESIYLDAYGREQTQFSLDKDHTLTLLLGYDTKARLKVVKRWQELEKGAGFHIPSTLSEALQLAADQAKQIEMDRPKVQHYDAVVERSGLLNATQVAQKVGISAVALNKHLDNLGVYNKAVKRGRTFKQWFVDDGLGELKQVGDGYTQALFTLKGEAWVIEKMISEGVYTPKNPTLGLAEL